METLSSLKPVPGATKTGHCQARRHALLGVPGPGFLPPVLLLFTVHLRDNRSWKYLFISSSSLLIPHLSSLTINLFPPSLKSELRLFPVFLTTHRTPSSTFIEAVT